MIFICLLLASCKLETSTHAWEWVSPEEEYRRDAPFTKKGKFYLGRPSAGDVVYCGKMRLRIKRHMKYKYRYLADTCDCLFGHNKSKGRWQFDSNSRLELLPDGESILPWTLKFAPSWYSPKDSIRKGFFFGLD